MAYLGDIRENSISPEGIIWENDNRKEERHYWNGALIDLCNLPGEDYAKTIFNTNGTSSDTNKKTSNMITVQQISYVNESGEEVYAYKAISKQPVTSNVMVIMTVQNEKGETETVEIFISVGESLSEVVQTNVPVTMAPPQVVTSNYSPKEDDVFKYETTIPENEIESEYPVAYELTMLKGSIDVISSDELVKLLNDNCRISMKDEKTSEKFEVKFTPIAVEGLSNMSVVEMSNALINNSQDIILVTDKNIVSIAQGDLPDVNEISIWTKKDAKVSFNGKYFHVWYKRDEGQTSQSNIYDPKTNDKVGVDSKEYIILYE